MKTSETHPIEARDTMAGLRASCNKRIRLESGQEEEEEPIVVKKGSIVLLAPDIEHCDGSPLENPWIAQVCSDPGGNGEFLVLWYHGTMGGTWNPYKQRIGGFCKTPNIKSQSVLLSDIQINSNKHLSAKSL